MSFGFDPYSFWQILACIGQHTTMYNGLRALNTALVNTAKVLPFAYQKEAMIHTTAFLSPNASILLGTVIGTLVGRILASSFLGRVFTGPAALATILTYSRRSSRRITMYMIQLVFFITSCDPYALLGALLGAHRSELALLVTIVIIIGTLVWIFGFLRHMRIRLF